MRNKKDIVVFDFDGTLSESDSNWEFAKYCFARSIRPWLFMPMIGAAWGARLFNKKGLWWREHIRRFVSPKMVEDFADDFIKQHKKNRFGWAKEQVLAEKKAGRIVLLVSASPDYLVRGLVDDIPFDAVLCSEMVKEKPWKYKFLCWGKNKVIAIDTWANKQKIMPRVVRSYSDSSSDMPMMKIADEQVWIDKKTGLRKQSC